MIEEAFIKPEDHIPNTCRNQFVTAKIEPDEEHKDDDVFKSSADEEDVYFENLNLSSRLKQVQTNKDDKIYFMCYICDKQFSSKVILKEHMHSHAEIRENLSSPEKCAPKSSPSGKKVNKCPYCGKEYLYLISFNKHLRQHERDKTQDQDSMPLEVSFEEEDSSIQFEGFDLNSGDSEDEKKFEQNFVKMETSAEVTKDAQCDVCQESFDSHEKLKEHRTTHEDTVLEESSEGNKSDLRDDKEEKTAEEGLGKRRKFKCSQCSTSYLRKKPYLRHLASHRGRFACKSCSQEFKNKDSFKLHMEQHGKTRVYKCTQCCKTFSNELMLRNHLILTNHKTMVLGQEYDPNKRIKRVAAKAAQKMLDRIKVEDDSEDEEDTNEENANESESYEPSVKESRAKRVGKKVQECTECGQKFASKLALMKHMETHVKNEDKETGESAEKVKKEVGEQEQVQERGENSVLN